MTLLHNANTSTKGTHCLALKRQAQCTKKAEARLEGRGGTWFTGLGRLRPMLKRRVNVG